MHITTGMWRSEDNTVEFLPFFFEAGSEDSAQMNLWFYLSILNCIRVMETELSGLHGSAHSDTQARVSITELSFGECLLVDSSLHDNPGCLKNISPHTQVRRLQV